MNIQTKVIVGDEGKSQRDFYDELRDAMKDGWILAFSKHKKGLSFCILYKEVK